ncbi:MAG: HAD hydrolase-like protein [bacterium]
MKKIILYDFDDTLVNTFEAKVKQNQELARKYYQKEISREHIANLWGRVFPDILQEIVGVEDSIDNLYEKYQTLNQDFPLQALPGAKAIIEFGKQVGLLQGIITTNTRKVILSQMIELGFSASDFFYLQAGEDTNVHKPDPAVFLGVKQKILELGWQLSDAIYIGDSTKDMIACEKFGLDFIAVTTGLESNEEFLKNKIPTFSNLFAVKAYLLTHQ